MAESRGWSVVVIGAGITGMALAFELARRGTRDVLVLDRSYMGAGATGRNVGRIRAMQLTPELVRFAMLAQAKHERLSDELGSNTLFWRAGYAWVLYEDEEVERMASLLPMFADLKLRRPVLHEGARAVTRAMPILEGGEPPAGALLGHDAIGHHDATLYAYRRACERAGVRVLERTAVAGILREGDRVAGVRTAQGVEHRAANVVNATDGWAREVSELAGLRVPNTPVRREVLVTETSRPFMSPAVTFYRPVEGWFNQTLRGELVAGVTDPDEPPGLNQDGSFGFLTRTASTLMRKAPRLGNLRVIRQWAGVYDMTPDRKPLVGPVAAAPGFVQANGTSGRGFALAPLIAELLAEWLTSGRRPELLEPFDPDRFDGRGDDRVLTRDYYEAYRTPGEDERAEGR